MTRIARQRDGIVINRHAALPELGHVYAELRPDAPVRTGPPRWHHHPSVRTKGEVVPVIPDGPSAGRELSKRRIYSLAAMQRNGHIARDKNPDDHAGRNNEAVHCHVPKGKYIFPPTPVRDGRKDRSVNYAMRLDVHPLALPMIE
jgi:hypothetical protein